MRKVLSRLGLLLLFASLTAVSFWLITRQNSPGSPDPGRAGAEKSRGDQVLIPKMAKPTSKNLEEVAPPLSTDLEPALKVGWAVLTATDPWGRQIAKESVLPAGGWVPVPVRMILGASRLVLSGHEEGVALEVELEQGSWRSGEQMMLWRVPNSDSSAKSRVSLGAWNAALPLMLQDRSDRKRLVEPVELRREGSFQRFELSVEQMVGLLVQERRVVGWMLEKWEWEDSNRVGNALVGWLWEGEPGDRIPSELTMERFYQITFGGGREEAWAEALAEQDTWSRLTKLAEAYLRAPKLEPEERPVFLAESAIVARLVADVVGQIGSGKSTEISELFSSHLVGEIGQPDVLLVAVQAANEALGPGSAIELGLRWWSELVPEGSSQDRVLNGMIRQYYSSLLFNLLEVGEFNQGWRVYREARESYPDEADFHLRGVELQLADGEWRLAEEQLNSRTYPVRFAPRQQELAAQIAMMKAAEGSIVIRFAKGSNRVMTRAMLEGSIEQPFIVDTGASITTIPKAAAQRLGIRITSATPRVLVRTAGGDVQAVRVKLDSLTIQGWTTKGVEVLVHDLPGAEQWGLLGLNFLNQFKMTMDSERGILILKPK